MSTKLNGTKSSRPGSRVPTHLLETAITWEAFRESLAPVLGLPERGREAGALRRNYERRLFEETDQQ